MFRLTNIDPDNLEDADRPGDRTLSAIQCQDYIFSTHTIGNIDTDYKSNI